MNLPKEYTVMAITLQNLFNDGWKLHVDDKSGEIDYVENEDGEHKYFCSGKEFKDWVLEKALDY